MYKADLLGLKIRDAFKHGGEPSFDKLVHKYEHNPKVESHQMTVYELIAEKSATTGGEDLGLKSDYMKNMLSNMEDLHVHNGTLEASDMCAAIDNFAHF
jgi:hypothetical protein